MSVWPGNFLGGLRPSVPLSSSDDPSSTPGDRMRSLERVALCPDRCGEVTWNPQDRCVEVSDTVIIFLCSL